MSRWMKCACLGLWLSSATLPTNAQADEEMQIADTQAALQACIDQEEGAVCSFTNSAGESINGLCGTNVSEQLTCIAYQTD